MITSRVSITFHSFRYRLADSDGLSGKAVIDGLIKCGVLKDDSTKQIKEVRFIQTKIKKVGQETTVITIED